MTDIQESMVNFHSALEVD